MLLLQGDCLELLSQIETNTIDLIFCDLPYNALPKQEWDKKIDLDKLWIEIERVRKINTPIFFTTTTKYGVEIINSAPKKCPYRYDLVWRKSNSCGHLRSGTQPLRLHELIYVFYEKLPFYNKELHTYKWEKKQSKNKKRDSAYGKVDTPDLVLGETNAQSRYEPPLPVSVIDFPSTKGYHKTEKPQSLLEWILTYYSKEGDLILDPTMGCGSTGEACNKLNRVFIGMELNKEFFDIAKQRILR